MKRSLTIIMLAVLLILAACAKTNGGEEPLTEQPTEIIQTEPEDTYPVSPDRDLEETYPITPDRDMEESYPIEEDSDPEDMYPIQEPNEDYGPSFTIDEPIEPDSNIVTGTGPAGVPIRLVDVTTMGEELALTTIDEDGTFTFELEQPLVLGHTVGLMIGDLAETEFDYDDFMYSNEYIDKPMIGILFTVAVVPY